MMIENRRDLKKRRNRLKRKAKFRRIILSSIIKSLGVGSFIVIFVLLAKNGMLNDMPKEYTIPEGAISGGEYIGKDGVIYERFQLGDKFYILSKENGAKIPQN